MRVRALWFAVGAISTLVALAAAYVADTLDGFRV